MSGVKNNKKCAVGCRLCIYRLSNSNGTGKQMVRIIMVRHDAQRIHVHNGMSTFFKRQKQVHYYKFTKKANILKFKQIMSAYQKQNLEQIFKFIRNINKSFVLYAVSQHCLYCIYLYIYLYPFCISSLSVPLYLYCL